MCSSRRAIAPVPLTLPSHSTLFTGLLPPRHGVRDNGGYVLDPKHPTLAELLKREGWQTGAFVGAFVLDSKWGLNKGFDTYHDKFDVSKYQTVSLGGVSRRAGEVVQNAMPWLEQHVNQRFFAWLHFYDAHTPYDAPEPFRSRFRDRPTPAKLPTSIFEIGRLLQWLDTKGIADRTIVIAIGDHGESLNEHGEATHGLFIYDATMRVPFIIRAPYDSMRGRRVSGTVRTEDAMPTVLDLVGKRVPDSVQGRSLVPLMTGQAPTLELDAYSESLYATASFRMERAEVAALWTFQVHQHDTSRALRPGARSEREAEPLRRPPAARGSDGRRADGSERRRAPRRGRPPSIPKRASGLRRSDTSDRSATSPERRARSLPDPKDKIDIFNLMTAAREAGEGDDATLNRLLKVVSQDANVLDAWVMLGNEYFRQARIYKRRRTTTSARCRSIRATTWRSSISPAPIRPWVITMPRCSATNATWRPIRRMRGSGINSASSTSTSDSSRKRNARSSSR